MGETPVSTAKISVWWDIENCPVPSGLEPHIIARNLSSVLRQANFKGPISISAYGDTKLLTPSIQLALTSTGIHLHHIPSGRKDASDKAILVDMIFWALDNPPPAHILLISGDRDFANALHRLRMKTYDILLAQPLHVHVSPHLLEAASNVWYWANLAKGEAIAAEKQGFEREPSSLGYPTISSAFKSPTSLPRFQPEHTPSPQLLAEQLSMSNKILQETTLEMASSSISSTSNPQGRLVYQSKSSDPQVIRQIPDQPNTILPSYPPSRQHPQVGSNHFQEQQHPSLRVQHIQQHAYSSANAIAQVHQKRSDEYPSQHKGHSAQRLPHEHFSAEVRSSESPASQHHHCEQNGASISSREILRQPAPTRFGNLQHIQSPSFDGVVNIGPRTRNGFSSNVRPDPSSRFNPTLVSVGPHARNRNISNQQPKLASWFHPLYVISELRTWLVNIILKENGQNGYDISQVRQDFELASGIRLESPQPLGYMGILDLFSKNFSDVMIIRSPSKGLSLIYSKTANTVSVSSGNEEVFSKQLTVKLISNKPSRTETLNEAPCQDQIPRISIKNSSLEGILKKLNSLFLGKVRKSGIGYDVSLIPKDFQLMYGIPLDLNELGFNNIRNLVEYFKDVVRMVTPRPGLCVLYLANQRHHSTTLKEEAPSYGVKSVSMPEKIAATEYSENLLGNCRTFLCTFLQGKSEGYPQGSLVEEFQKTFDCELDYKGAGYAKLDDLLDNLADVVRVETSASGHRLLHLVRTLSSPNELGEKGVQEEKQDGKNISGSKDPTLSTLSPVGEKVNAISSPGDTSGPSGVSSTSAPHNGAMEYAGKVLMDCRVLLCDLFSCHLEGLPQVMLQEAFQRHHGYELNYKEAGFSNLDDLVEALAEVVQVQSAAGGLRVLHPTKSLSHSNKVGLCGTAAVDNMGEKESFRTSMPAVCQKEKKVWQKVNVLFPVSRNVTGALSEEPQVPPATSTSVSEKLGAECHGTKLLIDCNLSTLSPPNEAGEKGVQEEEQDGEKISESKDPPLSMLSLVGDNVVAISSPGDISGQSGVFASSLPDNVATKYAGKVLMDCRVLLCDFFSCHLEGLPQVMLQEAFQRRHGYDLNYKEAGFSNLDDLVEALADVVQVQSAAGGLRVLHPVKRLSLSNKVELCGTAVVDNFGEKESVRTTMLAVCQKEKKVWQKVNVLLPANKNVTGALSEDPQLPPATPLSVSEKLGAEYYGTRLLIDCKMLLQRILPRYPGGFHLAKLPQEFEWAYGYVLDYKAAGYAKLNDLLGNFMDFLRVEALPHCVVYLRTAPSLNKQS